MLRDKLILLPQQTAFSTQQRAEFIAQNNKRTRLFKVRVSATVEVTVAGTLVRNDGSVLGLLSNIGVAQGSTDQVNFDARMLRHYTEWLSQSRPPARRLSVAEVVAKGTFNLFEEVFIAMAFPYSVTPSQTYFKEKNPQNAVKVFLQQAPAPILTDGTIVVTNLAATVTQLFDEDVANLPLFLPYLDMVELNIAGAVANGRVDLRGSDFLAAIIVQQDTNLGEVADIINSLSYLGDGVEIVGPPQVPWRTLTDGMCDESGGAADSQRFAAAGDTASVPNFVTATPSWWVWNHVKSGRLSCMLPPNQIPNLRLEVNAQPSALAGATTSNVRVGRIWYSRQDVNVVKPELPFAVGPG